VRSTRTSRLRDSHSYRLVLALVAGVFVFAATAPDGGWSASSLLLVQTATLLAALWTSGRGLTTSPVTAGLVGVSVPMAVAQLLSGNDRLAGAVALLTGALVVTTIVIVALGVRDQHEVNAQSVTAAICIYLLLGLFFVFVYGAMAALQSGPFFLQGTDGTRALRLYFSYVTLATLGYGDYTPAGNLGHLVALIEALVGQLYLVTVVALLVSRIGPRGRLD
jgi:hypothetical protein